MKTSHPPSAHPTPQSRTLRLMRACTGVLLASFASLVFADVSPLSVRGNQVLAGGQPASFAGNSLFWSNTGWGGEKFYNANVVRWLKNDWNSKLVRASMGVEDANGYLQDPAGNKARVKAVVDAAIANDMYVIIDWHSHKAENYRPQAIAFFEEMARTYGKSNHVIYEIYNEPLQVSWSNTIKPYAQAVINAIRAIDPDNLIIVGTPNWSQDVDVASRDKLSGTNIAYALHFYAGTHGQQLRDKAQTALNNGVALFVTEWGSVSANGDGAVAEAETMAWVRFMKEKGLSNANWALNDKAEGASALIPGASPQGGWSNAQLTRSGTLAKQIISTWAGNGPGSCSRVSIPARLEAEAYCQMSGIQVEPTNDSGGGSNVGYIDTGDWMTYDIEVPAAGRYKLAYRVASAASGGRIQFEKGGGGTIYGMLDFPGTGDWQRWTTVSHEVTLPAGQQTVAVRANQGGFNLNWLEISRVDQGDSGGSQPGGSSSSSSAASSSSSSTSNGSGSSNSGGVAQSSDTLPAGLYTIVNAGSGLCVDVAGASNADGGNIQQARCNSSNAQVFEITQPSAGVLTLKNLASGKLMDVASASTADGANIQQWASNNTNAQRFRATRSQGNRYALVNVGSNKCVDITAASSSDGANVQQYACNGSAAQQFLFYPWNASKRGALPVGRYSIGSQHSKLCLGNAGGNNADGTRIVQTNCSATATQRFDLLPEAAGTYRLVNVSSGKSLDIADISTANGALLTQWSATNGDNQRFIVDSADGGYRIQARHSQRCLDLKDWNTSDGGLVQQWSCGSQANQRWSFTPAESSGGTNPAPPANGWKLVWQDEFDGNSLNTQKWNYEVNGGGGNNELQYYTDRPQNVTVANGVLSIHALAERYCSTDGCRDYTSARLTTRNKGDWRYGRIEVRAKLPRGQGLWPAIWMLPTDWVYGGWAASGEIDIMEAVNPAAAGGNTVHGTLHFGGAWPNNTHKGQSFTPASSVVDNFHVYAVEWEERQIRFYVNDVLYHTATEWWSSSGAFPAPFNQRFHILLNVAVGGNWPGSPNASTRFPQRMDVDYVRVYQK